MNAMSWAIVVVLAWVIGLPLAWAVAIEIVRVFAREDED